MPYSRIVQQVSYLGGSFVCSELSSKFHPPGFRKCLMSLKIHTTNPLTIAVSKHKLLRMNVVSAAKKIQFLGCIVEGMGVRAACRLVGIAKGTGLRLVREVGAACEAFQRQWIRDLDTKRVECDEVWAFCYSKEKNVPDFV